MSVAATLPVSPIVAPAPLATPTPADREPGPHPFAELLRQSRTAGTPKHEEPAPSTPSETARADTEGDAADSVPLEEPTAPSETAPRGEAARGRARASATSPRPSARAAERTDASPERATVHSTRDEDRTVAGDAADAPPGSPTALAIRPDPTRSPDPEPRLGAAAHHAAAPAVAMGRDTVAGPDGRGLPGAVSGAVDGAARRGSDDATRLADAAGRADARADAAHARDGNGEAAATAFAQQLGDARSANDRGIATARTPAEPAALPGTAVPAGVAPPAPASTDAAPAPHAAALPTPIDSPEFPAALGVQVSVFLREGVQHAELHLNPAETGPVSIAITLEGSQAHVAFGADLAATREAIESGLPALASALRDAGFTLAGGGVAQHSRPGGGGHGSDDPSRHGPDARRTAGRVEGDPLAAAATSRTIRRVAAGGVDVYA